jgi:hypothetical protein
LEDDEDTRLGHNATLHHSIEILDGTDQLNLENSIELRSPASHASVRISNRNNTNDHDSDQLYLTELSSLQFLIARQTAALALHPLVEKYYTMNKLLETIDTVKKKKNSIWSKMLGAMSTSSKKNKVALGGILGKPLDVLVHETGVASNASYGAGTVIIPFFMDECISALQRKGFFKF